MYRLLIMVSALILFGMAVPTAFAQTETPIGDFIARFGNVLPVAVLIGIINAGLGYFRTTPPEDFDLVKLIVTMLISGLIGVLTVGLGWSYEEAQEWLANGTLTLWLYWLAKIIAMRVGWVPTTPKAG